LLIERVELDLSVYERALHALRVFEEAAHLCPNNGTHDQATRLERGTQRG
jgi:hypothetical protein